METLLTLLLLNALHTTQVEYSVENYLDTQSYRETLICDEGPDCYDRTTGYLFVDGTYNPRTGIKEASHLLIAL